MILSSLLTPTCHSRAVGNRGLGIAIAGGLAFSIVLTPTVVPALMALLQDFSRYRRKHNIGN
jgi:hydrophobic/amphiphilic exporter-1 (mainly G- bacteria), HAE1 family